VLAIKRILDIAVSLTAFIVSLPVMAMWQSR
jgi:lipopolysaccharide/colanic/teichoic acid biosynthesis glycosyltransferase